MLGIRGPDIYLLLLNFAHTRPLLSIRIPGYFLIKTRKGCFAWKASSEGVRRRAELAWPLAFPEHHGPAVPWAPAFIKQAWGPLGLPLSHVNVGLMVVISQCPVRERVGSHCPPLLHSMLSDAFDEGMEGSLANRTGY